MLLAVERTDEMFRTMSDWEWWRYCTRKRVTLFLSIVFRDWNDVLLWPKMAWGVAGIVWHYDDDWGRKMWNRRKDREVEK